MLSFRWLGRVLPMGGMAFARGDRARAAQPEAAASAPCFRMSRRVIWVMVISPGRGAAFSAGLDALVRAEEGRSPHDHRATAIPFPSAGGRSPWFVSALEVREQLIDLAVEETDRVDGGVRGLIAGMIEFLAD